MRIVHLADLHLGFRRYARQNSDGINQREADVAETCMRAVKQIAALSPDIVLVAGDVFHQVRPANTAILEGYRIFSALRLALPQVPIVMIAGNHDVPRSRDTACILDLFRQLDIHVVWTKTERIDFPGLDASVLAVPFIPEGVEGNIPQENKDVALSDPSRKYNILVCHGEVRGVLPDEIVRSSSVIDPLDLSRSNWSYVALGHYHVYRQIPLALNGSGEPIPCYYSGSLDYTSTNPWFDLKEESKQSGYRKGYGKGFIEHDLLTGKHVFHPVNVVRGFEDLPAIDGTNKSAEELGIAIGQMVQTHSTSIDNAVVRLVVNGVNRSVARTIDFSQVREVRRKALHFQLDIRPPLLSHQKSVGDGTVNKRITLNERLIERLQSRTIPPNLQRDRFVTLGVSYLQRAEEMAADSRPVEEG